MILEEVPCQWQALQPVSTININLVTTETSDPFSLDQDLRKVTNMKIGDKIMGLLEDGAPFTDQKRTEEVGYTDEEVKYAQQLSISFSEHIVDRGATPHVVRFSETVFPVDPFIGRKARPLIETQTTENDLDEEEDG